MERILITGASGFLGSALVDRLSANNAVYLGVTHEMCDITDKQRFFRLCQDFNPTVLYHLAGHTGMAQSVEDPEGFFRANVDTTISVLEACRKLRNIRLVYASSFAVYGSCGKPALETDQLQAPENPYAASKQTAEIYVEMYSRMYGFPAVSLRIFSSFGPRQKKYTAIYTFIDAIYRGTPLVLFDNGTAKRDYMYVENAVDGMLLAMQHNKGHDVFNLGQNLNLSLSEIVQIMEKLIGKKANVTYQRSPPGVMGTMSADISKIRNYWGFMPSVNFEQGLKQTFTWYNNEIHGGE